MLEVHADITLNTLGISKVVLTPAKGFSYKLTGTGTHNEEMVSTVEGWMEAFLSKDVEALEKYTLLPFLDFGNSTQFTRSVLTEMYRIPIGSYESYSTLAAKAGHCKAARAVGTVCRRNPFPLIVPCHRVLPANPVTSGIGQFAYGQDMKRQLLKFEGISFYSADIGSLTESLNVNNFFGTPLA